MTEKILFVTEGASWHKGGYQFRYDGTAKGLKAAIKIANAELGLGCTRSDISSIKDELDRSNYCLFANRYCFETCAA